MLNSLQIAGLVGFNLALLALTFVAFRLIGTGHDRQRGRARRGAAGPEELFSFDSWSETDRSLRPRSDGRRSDREGR